MHKKIIRGTPYYYTSIRDNEGKVKTIYLGKTKQDAEKRETELRSNGFSDILNKGKRRSFPYAALIFIFIFAIVSGFFVIVMGDQITGFFGFKPKLQYNQPVKGFAEIILESEDFLPSDTMVSIYLNGQAKNFDLSEIIDITKTNLDLLQGSFYSPGTSLSGSGEGYGLKGEKKIYPELAFRYNLITYYDKSDRIISESNIIEGTVNYFAPYSYQIDPYATNYEVNILSVRMNEDDLSLSVLNLEMHKGSFEITTDYYKSEEGYGKDFKTDKILFIDISLDDLGFTAPIGDHNLKIKISYNGIVIDEKNVELMVYKENEDTDSDNIINKFDNCVNTPTNEIDKVTTDPLSKWYGCGPSERNMK